MKLKCVGKTSALVKTNQNTLALCEVGKFVLVEHCGKNGNKIQLKKKYKVQNNYNYMKTLITISKY